MATLQSVERTLHLLETLAEHGGNARLSELAGACGLSKSTAHGMLDTLVALGYVSREGSRYTLGLRVQALAGPAEAPARRLREGFAPALAAFTELTGQRCVLAVPGGSRAYLTLDGLDGDGQRWLPPADAQRDALATSAVGQVFLAHDHNLLRRLRREAAQPLAVEPRLAQISRQGYALDLGASRQGLHCFALPLRVRGQVVAALGAQGSAQQLAPARLQRLARRAMRELFELISC